MRAFILLLALFMVFSCSRQSNSLYQTVKIAATGGKDALLTNEYIQQLPYSSIYVRVDGGPQIFVVQGFYENGIAKWVSADFAMIATHKGRIVKTTDLYGGNLDSVTNLSSDPLALGLHLNSTPKEWCRAVDWSPGYRYNHSLHSFFQKVGSETLTILGVERSTLHFTETVQLLELKQSYQNEFWIDPMSGKVLKSRQHVTPDTPWLELTALKGSM